MTSYSGSVAYLSYVSKTDKGGIKKDFEFNGVFGLGKSTPERTAFSSQVIVEKIGSDGKTSLEPVECGKFVVKEEGKEVAYDAKVIDAEGKVSYKKASEMHDLPEGVRVAYFSNEFQMEHVPAEDIPTIGPKMNRIALVAEPRRIAVRYDQITAFQAKTDYGFSLDKQIAEQACGELAYEIDTEIVEMLAEGAKEGDVKLTWDRTLPVGVSKFEHYNGFLEVIEEAKAEIYRRTGKFHPNYMVIAADVLPVLRFVNGFTAVKNAKMNGPYKVGELDGLNIYVSPALGKGEFFLGLNGSDMMSSAGVYAPYMAIVPTQLLGTPDGGLAQGFSTWYAKALLNKSLLIAGEVTGVANDYRKIVVEK
jgi:hypothetical protein